MPLSSVLGAASVIKAGVVTSSTRPSVPYVGQMIYESDTNQVRAWNGSSWVYVGPTPISAVETSNVSTTQYVSSTSYTDLGTVGPSVTITTGTSAIAVWGARYDDNTNAGADGWMSVAVSGATTLSASDSWSAYGFQGFGGDNQLPIVFSYKFTGLTAGSNTFTAKYRRSGGTQAGFSYRWLTVFAI